MARADPPALAVNANDVVAFFVELGVLVLIGVAGWQLGGSTPVRVALAVVLPGLAAVLWGAFAAPRARFQVGSLRLATKVLVLGAGVLAGSVVLPTVWAWVTAVVVVVNLVLMYVGPFARPPVS